MVKPKDPQQSLNKPDPANDPLEIPSPMAPLHPRPGQKQRYNPAPVNKTPAALNHPPIKPLGQPPAPDLHPVGHHRLVEPNHVTMHHRVHPIPPFQVCPG